MSEASRVEPHRGVLILILGILSLMTCQLLGPIAWIMGNADMRKIRAGTMDREGESLTNIGRILGLVATILLIVSLVVSVIVLAIFGTALFVAMPHVDQPGMNKAAPGFRVEPMDEMKPVFPPEKPEGPPMP